MKIRLFACCACLLTLAGILMSWATTTLAGTPAQFSLVILHGRVIDPESRTERLANVGVRDGRIAAITGRSISGAVTIESRDKVVAPGFVDILSDQSETGDPYKIADGVTTVISTHGGPIEVASYLEERTRQGTLLNFGTVTGHRELRNAAGADDIHLPATPDQVRRMVDLADVAMRQGALGIGFDIEYIPGTSGQEVIDLARVAAKYQGNVHAHIRLPHLYDPFQGINELIVASSVTGVRTQVVHLGSMAIRRMPESLALIDQARERGIDIAADIYPYDAWMTYLQSAIFEPGWQEKYHLSYSDLVWVATGERITEATFSKFRAQGGLVACHQIAEADIEMAMQHPAVCVASDGTIGSTESNHPRGAGTFCRVLGEYVRKRRVLSLMEALRKMTYQPAERMERAAPAMRKKGRLRPGMDADLVVFDPDTVSDRATYANPRQYSKGVEAVVVNGELVYRGGKFAEGVKPGRALRGNGESGKR